METEVIDPYETIIRGEVTRSPYRFDHSIAGECVGFDENHTLSDIARWITSQSKQDAEEMIRILSEMVL